MRIATFICLLLTASARAAAPAYEQVHALFAANCLACHDAKEAEGGLVLESHVSLLKGGDSGPAVVPGKAAESLLVQLVAHQKKPFMPPPKKAAKLQDREIALVRAWIDAGALPPTVPVTTKPTIPKIAVKATPRPSVYAAACSPAARQVAAARHGVVELYSAESRELLRKLEGHRGNVNAIAFSSDGKLLAAASGEAASVGVVHLWNTATGALIRTFEGHKDGIYAVAISGDARTLATGSYDQTIMLWDLDTGAARKTLEGHNGSISDLAFRPDGKVLASASADRTIKLWDAATGDRLDTFSEPLKEQNTLAWHPDGRSLAAAGADNRIRVWDVSTTAKEGTNRLVHAQFAHEGSILRIAFSADGALIASSGDDRRVKLWQTGTFVQQRILAEQGDWPAALAFSLESKQLIVGRLDGALVFYDAASGAELAPPKPQITAYSPRAIERGKPTRITITGKALTAVKAAKFSSPGASASVVNDAGRIVIEVTPAAGTAVGSYDLLVTTAAGDSPAVKVFVADLPPFEVADESGSAPLPATLPAVLMGSFEQRGDADAFTFHARKGDSLIFDAAARRIASKAAPALALLDASGRAIGSSRFFDDGGDALLHAVIPADGRYTLKVTDVELGAGKDFFYRVHAGSFGLVSGTHPMGVPANAETQVRLLGVNLPRDAKLTVKATRPGESPLALDERLFRSRRPISVVVGAERELVEEIEREPNGSPAQAQPIDAPAAVNGRIHVEDALGASDADLYSFTAKKGEPWVIETLAARRSSPLDTRVEVLHGDGRPVERVLLRALRDSYITFRSFDALQAGARLANYEEMELNQFLYMNGEVAKLFLEPRGPDSEYQFYSSAGRRRTYFDTTAVAHALDEPCYIVEPHPPGAKLAFNGLPVFKLNYVNDDDSLRQLGSDSRLHFVAPADGTYLIRVTDTRGKGFSGDRFAYRLIVRPGRPDFNVVIDGAGPAVPAGTGRSFTLRADRIDGFDDPIKVEITGLPPRFTVSSPIVIEAGHLEAKGVLFAAADAATPTKENNSATRVVCTAFVGGKPVTKPAVNTLGMIALGGKPPLGVALTPVLKSGTPATRPAHQGQAMTELTIAPGQRIAAMLWIERHNHKGTVSFDLENLPHGVIVSDIGLNGVLITEKENDRQIFIEAESWVAETDRICYARAREAGNPTTFPVLLKVRKPAASAQE